MGCGGSRLGGAAGARANEGGVVPLPEGIRPLLRRRLEEMKKRSHASVLKGSQTLSKKELLRHGSSEDGEEAEENEDSLKLSAKVAPVPDHHHAEEKKEVVYEKISSINGVKEGEELVKKQDEKIDDAISIKKEGNDEDITVKNQGDGGLDHDDHDEGRMSSFDERMICHGSPSFRVYCVNVTSSDDEDDDDDKGKDGEGKRKSMETESVTIESKEQNESIPKKEKRERKGKRFGMALPRKYLANVTAPCYAGVGRGCMGNNTNTRVVQEKSSQ